MSIKNYIMIYNKLNKVNNKFLFTFTKKGVAMYIRIRNLREDADMTQAEIAKILYCSQRVYSNYERGELDIPTEILIKLANFHNVSVDYILNRTDKKETNR